ncbi:hypothetical protein [Sulfuricystis multivorans]|uniref:hypothetical protein n=1 Tax=Sulfuricystis multivorans TaxID=2211108 RepID=UPI000F845AC4|nr:hypothetical protein [Sulfuricystis multivorans]
MAFVAAQAYAIDNLVSQAIMDAVQFHQRAYAANNLRRVTAYYLGDSGGCGNVAVESSDKRSREHYRVCDGVIEQRQDVEPSAPTDDPNYRRTVVAVGRQALLAGAAIGRFEGYVIEARRVGWSGRDGCGTVDVTVTYGDLMVDNGQPRVCP